MKDNIANHATNFLNDNVKGDDFYSGTEFRIGSYKRDDRTNGEHEEKKGV